MSIYIDAESKPHKPRYLRHSSFSEMSNLVEYEPKTFMEHEYIECQPSLDEPEPQPIGDPKNDSTPDALPNTDKAPEQEPGGCRCCGVCLTALSYFLAIVTFPIAVFFCFRTATDFERVVIFRLGRLRTPGVRGPGLFCVLPCIDEYIKVDLRVVTLDVSPQETLTKDAVTVQVNGVIYYHIKDPLKAVTLVADVCQSMAMLTRVTLRNAVATKMLSELIREKEVLSRAIQKDLEKASVKWGVQIERVDIKDIRIPVTLQRALVTEAEAAHAANAKIIAAEGERTAAQTLKHAAEIIGSSPGAMQLKYLEAINSISSDQKATVIIPFPMELLSACGCRSCSFCEEN